MKKLLVVFMLMVSMMGIVSSVSADNSEKNDDKKVWICHRNQGTKEYVEIEISENALDAHLKHQWGEDIYPVPEGGCPAPVVVTPEPTVPVVTPTVPVVTPTVPVETPVVTPVITPDATPTVPVGTPVTTPVVPVVPEEPVTPQEPEAPVVVPSAPELSEPETTEATVPVVTGLANTGARPDYSQITK